MLVEISAWNEIHYYFIATSIIVALKCAQSPNACSKLPLWYYERWVVVAKKDVNFTNMIGFIGWRSDMCICIGKLVKMIGSVESLANVFFTYFGC